jgi:hypothetical protein
MKNDDLSVQEEAKYVENEKVTFSAPLAPNGGS